MHVHAGAVGERDGKDGQRAGLASEPDRASGQLVPRSRRPTGRPRLGDAARQPEPAHDVVLIARPSSLRNACSARLERRDSRRVALGEPRRQAVQEEVDRPWRLIATRLRRARERPPRPRTPRPAAEAAGEDRRAERLEVRLAREPGVERFEPFGRIEQQRRSVAPALSGRTRSGRAAAPSARAEARPAGRSPRPRGARTPRPAPRPRTWPAPRPARARPAGQDRESARSPARESAAAAAMPPRPCARSADRSSSPATASSGPAAAWARCHARRSGSALGSVASASARCTSWRVTQGCRAVGRRAHQRMTEPHPGTELDQSRPPRPARLRRRRSRAARPRATAGSRRPPARLPPRGEVAASRPGATARAGGSSARCGSPAAARREAPNPPASSAAVNPWGNSSSASGLPRRLGDDPIAYPLVQPPRDRRVQQRASIARRSEPPTTSHRQARQLLVLARARAPRTPRRPIPPGGGAQRTPRICAEARSSHCASSTRQTSGRSSATSDSRLKHGQTDQKAIRRLLPPSGRRPCPAHRAAGPAGARGGPATARRADARRRTRAPSRTRRPPLARCDNPSALATR